MHLYTNKKNRIAKDRPQGINIPGSRCRHIKCVSGDTLTFTANVVVPSTREPVKKDDLAYTNIYIAVAENRFSPVIWSGSVLDRWIVLDDYRNGLIHVTVPRTVMGVLRRGSYGFSIVVDDGIVRETQLVGSFQIEYEPTGSINDIPYRSDQDKGAPISLTPEVDLAAQDHHRLTYDQLIRATDTITRTLIGVNAVATLVFAGLEHEPTESEMEHAIHRLSQLILWDDDLRAKIPTVVCETYDPTFTQLVQRIQDLLQTAGMGWEAVPCRPDLTK